MNNLLQFIAAETHGTSYKTNKKVYNFEQTEPIDYSDDKKISVNKRGETDNRTPQQLNLKHLADSLQESPLFQYFLDGSRQAYKVDDIAYDQQVYPIIAGQISVGICSRTNKNMHAHSIKKSNTLVLPQCADKDGNKDIFFKSLNKKINNLDSLKKINIQFEKLLYYSNDTLKDDQSFENKGVAKVQDEMILNEKELVQDMVSKKLLNEQSYLLKDGSLEYQSSNKGSSLNDLYKIRNNYNHVIGVSKSFNPDLFTSKDKKSNAAKLADLELYHRTPAYMFESERSKGKDGNVFFAVWYVRVRSKQYTDSPFDGIVKLEKMVTTAEEERNGMESELIDVISANIINERNPVCYGVDPRWANHLYPIHITERFIKSHFLSNVFFMNIFK